MKYIYYTKSVFMNESDSVLDDIINTEITNDEVELFSSLSIGATVLLMFRKQLIEESSGKIKKERTTKNG